ncbi:MAG: hypothetical protein PHC49_16175 [Desulfuromonadaceae bacterium]|nr:hypothetical protein [Desulfuromonadaceae bacterium]
MRKRYDWKYGSNQFSITACEVFEELMPHRELQITFHQVLRNDGSVHSHQWIALTADCASVLTVEKIVERYLAYLRTFTVGLVRPQRTADCIALKLSGVPLICLNFPVITRNGAITNADLFINGGFLVQRDFCNRGHLRFAVIRTPEQVRIEIRLSDYYPLLLGTSTPTRFRRWLIA